MIYINLADKLLSKAYLFRRIVTLSIEEFQLLAEKLESEWDRREFERLVSRPDRKKAVGQGRHYELGNFSNLLLATLIYLRSNMGYEFLGFLFDVDQSTIKRVVKRVMPLLQDRFIPKTALTKGIRRTNDLDEILEQYPELEEVIFDGAEMATRRPKKRQKQSYSGKKKRHTKKIQVARDAKQKLIIGVSKPKKGKIHDKKQLEQTNWDKKLPDKVKRRGDSGYQGMDKDKDGNKRDNWVIPHKNTKLHKLDKKQKRENRKNSKERIFVEHSIRGIKIFRRVGGVISIKLDDWLYNVILASANLANYKILVRQGLS